MRKNSLPHHLAALWFADIAGYSARVVEDERGALQLVEILQALSRSTVQRHEGRVVKFLGDAVLAEFPSTEMAVRAAAVLSKEYAEQSTKTGRAHDLRIGVHLGDVAVDADGDLYGDGVNAAARIEAAVNPGQVVVSEDVWRQIRGREGFRFEPIGNRNLKGVGSIDLYVVTLDESLAAMEEKIQSGEQRKEKIRSIAVLPFADLSAERDQEHFSDGVAEEILNALSKVAGLHVPARTSCFAFRGATMDAREIGKRLGVEALLDGSIRRAGKRVRISVQLVDANNGYQLWSERFDREIEDIFAIQDEIARSVLESLGLALTEREEFRFLKPSTTNIEAYEFYLRGRKLYHKWTRQSVKFARQMFERAVKVDPDFAAAWAGLANAYVDLFRWSRKPRDLEEAKRASENALKLNPNSAEAYVSAGQALAIQRRFPEAANAFERAIKEDPAVSEAYYLYGRALVESGDVEKAVELFEKAQQVRPDDYESHTLRAQALTELGREDEARRASQVAVECIEKHLELNPDEARAYSLGASLLIRLGQNERSKQWTQQAMMLAPADPLILYNAACNWALLGEPDHALDGLERAIEAGVAVGDWIKHDPDFASLRGHPRFQAIVKRIAPP
ncbi:MAG TPA: tetratricopeptide repeat protein [Candidatus Udaeobacter sp.]|nr:tetratricopeptide repeat protein [Candidatus Udaeobacter sp.]